MAPAILNYAIVIKFEATNMFLKAKESDHTRKNILMKDISFYLYR
jgi:hypothetical protein